MAERKDLTTMPKSSYICYAYSRSRSASFTYIAHTVPPYLYSPTFGFSRTDKRLYLKSYRLEQCKLFEGMVKSIVIFLALNLLDTFLRMFEN